MHTWAISDIHGSGLELENLINQINFSYSDNEFILVGDIFDRGKHGHIVWELIKKYNIEVCLGNHENKMIQFLSGERDNLPKHYYWALNNLINHGVKVEELYEWLISLPLLVGLERNKKKYIVTHAGVNLRDPYKTDISANVYGNLDGEKAMPKPKEHSDEKFWWDYYNQEPIVVYGHTPTGDDNIRIRYNKNNTVSSIGIDTGACRGGSLTAYCLETSKIVQYKSGIDYFFELKKEINQKELILHNDIINFLKVK